MWDVEATRPIKAKRFCVYSGITDLTDSLSSSFSLIIYTQHDDPNFRYFSSYLLCGQLPIIQFLLVVSFFLFFYYY